MSDNRMAILKRLEQEELERIAGYEKHTRREDGPLNKDLEDQATEQENDEVVMGLLESAKRRLSEARHAMERVENGVGDVCETCEAEIPRQRLAALPTATLCGDCAEDAT